MAHTFPRRIPRRAVAATAVLLTSTVLIAPAVHADNLKHKQHKVHRHVRQAKADFDDSSHALNHATARLKSARAQLATAQHRLAGTRTELNRARVADAAMRARLAAAQKQLAAAQAAVAQSKAEVADQRHQIGVLAAQNYQYGDPQLMGLVAVLKFGDPDDITSQLNTVHAMMSRQATTLDDLKAEEARLVVDQRKVAAAEKKVADQRAATAASLHQEQQLTTAAKEQTAQVADLVSSRRSAKARAVQVKTADQRQLRKLRRQEDRIKQQILARARHQRNHRVADTGGLLFRPVPGYITSPYGWRKHPIYGYWGLHDGDDFHAPCGTPERAAGSGTVRSEYYSSVWGNRLYLDLGKINGHNFTVIYNHIDGYVVGSGAHVSRGQVLAHAGTTGWSTGCHLHFTVMRDGAAVNPMDYIR